MTAPAIDRYLSTRGPSNPLLCRFEVPIWGEHGFAWLVDAGELDIARGGLRAVYERGDAAPLRALWQQLRPRYLAARARRSWRIPGATYRRVVADARRLWAQLKDDERADCGDAAAIARFLDVETERARVDFVPPRWFSVEHAHDQTRQKVGVSRRLRRMLAKVFIRVLHGASGALERPELDGPTGDFTWLSRLRFYDETTGEERAAEELRNPYRDRVRLDDPRMPDDASWTPDAVVEHVRSWVGMELMLDALVGPWTASGGPGPFFAIPEAAQPLSGPSWRRLAVFRAGERHDEHMPDLAADWFVLLGDVVDRARAELADAQPLRFAARDDDDYEPPRGWILPGTDDREAERYRGRFATLLETARRTGAAVLLHREEPTHCSLARDASWGEPVDAGR